MASFFLLLLNFAATLFMTGVIWFVQLVHYPLFARVGESGFSAYSGLHSQKTTWVVGPPMLLELATSTLLIAHPLPGIAAWQVWLGLALVGGLWLSTAFLQVPQHNKLGGGFQPAAHRFLVASNWLRTLLWSVRSALVFWMLFQAWAAVNRVR